MSTSTGQRSWGGLWGVGVVAIAPALLGQVALIASPAYASTAQVTQVTLNLTAAGVDIILETPGGDVTVGPEVVISQDEDTWIADITNIQLSPAAIFEQTDVTAGIEFISVRPLEANRIRVTVVGSTEAPLGELVSREGGFTFSLQESDRSTPAQAEAPAVSPEEPDVSVPVPDTSSDTLRIVVTGEAAGSDYFVPAASTATRTDTPLMEIPQAVQVIPQQVLEDQQATQLDDALRNVSGVVVDSSEGAGYQFAIRGFEGGRLLRDGFSLSASDSLSNTGLLALPDLANIEQIEVIKGPASILYGEIQPGGVINLVTEQPTDHPFYELNLQVGSRSFFRVEGDMSDWITSDGRVRYRLNTVVERDDGFRDFDQEIAREFIAPVVTWEMSDRTDLTIDLEYLSDERPIDSGLLAFGDGVIDVPRDRIAGEPDDVVERSFFSSGYRLEHEFSDNWSIRNAFRYSAQHYDSTAFVPVTFDETTGIVNRVDSTTDWYQDYYGFQTDLVGKFETGSIGHTLLFGVDVSHDRSDINSRLDLANLSPLDIFNPTYGTVERLSFGELPDAGRVQNVTTSRFGIFIQDQIDLSEQFKALAGIRYESVSQEVDNEISGFDPTGSESSQDVDDFTPRLGLLYQPVPELSLYANYSRSFTPSSATDINGELLEPEAGESFEIGLKTELFNRRLIATLAYFDITKQNVATLDPDAPATVNASVAVGEQRSQGIELDVSGEILPGWNVIANYAYTDARVTEDNTTPAGNDLTGIPEHSASLWTTYTLQQGNLAGLGFGLGLNYVGERPGDLDNSFTLDDYLTTDAAVFYKFDNVELALNFKNIFDVNYIQGIPVSRIRGLEPGDPFTIVGSISFKF